MFDLLKLTEAQIAITEALGEGVGDLGVDLATTDLGGSQLACTASVVHRPSGQSVVIIQPLIIGVTPATDRQQFLLYLAAQQRMMSERLPISTRLIIATGQGQENETTHFGSAVFALDEEGNYQLVVGCAGLRELVCEMYAELIGSNIKRRLVLLELSTPALAQ